MQQFTDISNNLTSMQSHGTIYFVCVFGGVGGEGRKQRVIWYKFTESLSSSPVLGMWGPELNSAHPWPADQNCLEIFGPLDT